MIQLRRVISSETWVPEIDGLRFVALMSVLVFHLTAEVTNRGPRLLHIGPPFMLRLFGNADRGVGLFFVISGFVLARPFYAQHRLKQRAVRLPNYFARRITRLEPPLLISMLIYALAWKFVMHWPTAPLVRHTLISSLYMHNLVYYKDACFPNFVTWSLEIEVQFYILAPLLCQLFRIPSRWQRRLWISALGLVGCFWSAFHWHAPYTILVYAGFFPAGLLLADIFDDANRSRTKSFAWDIMGLAGWMALILLPASYELRAFLPIVIVPTYISAFRGKLSSWVFRQPLLTTLGGMCYSLYLLHPLLMTLGNRLVRHVTVGGDEITFLVRTVLVFIVVIAGGMLFFIFIERPCMNKRWPQELLDWFQRVGRANRWAQEHQ